MTIGLVVYNGERHLHQAIESLRAQTFRDFALVIYDNASTDRTPGISQVHAASDQRIRVVRHDRNLGPLGNFITAAEQADTEFFCWATHDDLREPEFLATLVRLLRHHPDAGLACVAVRNMDPDGTLRDVRTETFTLQTTDGWPAFERLRMHLRDGPGTPFYGVFRTQALHELLPVLHGLAGLQGPALLGIDIVFIASFLKSHGLAVTHEPLLNFRRGGWSHRLDTYGSLRGYLRQLGQFHEALKRETTIERLDFFKRWRMGFYRSSLTLRYMFSAPMRRMTWHYFARAWPTLSSIQARWTIRAHPAFRRLRRRINALPRGTRIILFGAGKHTRRCLPALRLALRSKGEIVGIADDHPESCAPIAGLPIVTPSDTESLGAELVIVSSDTYEEKLYTQARAAFAQTGPVWCIYDTALEARATERSCASTEVKNLRMPSTESAESSPKGRETPARTAA